MVAMKLSNKAKLKLFAPLIILNIILRLQVVPNEIGADSFIVHIQTLIWSLDMRNGFSIQIPSLVCMRIQKSVRFLSSYQASASPLVSR